MVPGDVVILDELPYLDSGKVNRKALEQLCAQRKERATPPNGLASQRLQTVMDTVSQVLRTSADVHTDLVAAGLDSLSAIRLSSQLKQAGFPQADALILLECQTVLAIATELDKLEEENVEQSCQAVHKNSLPDLRQTVSVHPSMSDCLDNIDDVLYPTSVQAAMLAETARDNQAYWNWVEFEVAGSFVLESVLESIRHLAQQHALLRSGFMAISGLHATYAMITWKGLHPSQIRLVEHLDYDLEVMKETDLLHPCNFQVKPSATRIGIFLHIHHALYDQWSLDVLRADLYTLLGHGELGTRPSFRAVSQFHTKHFEDAHSERHLEFWHEHLRDFSPSLLPSMSGKRTPRGLQRTPWREHSLDLARLRRDSRKSSFTAPTVFQAAMAYLLGLYTGSTDVTYGVVFSGRHLPIPDIERVFGPCLATLPFRVDYSTARTCNDLLRMIRNQNRAMQKHSLTPLVDIKKVARQAPSDPLFDILFVWQETSLDRQRDAEQVGEVDSADHHEFNLVLEVEPSERGVRVRVTYQQALITLPQVQILIMQVLASARAMMENPECAVQNLLDWLPEAALSISNPVPQRSSPGHSLIGAIENRAMDHFPALVFASSIRGSEIVESQMLTYADLNMRANKLANFIQSQIITPNDVICICMEKSIDLYVAILATIKAGFGYLPLVPDTPRARIRSILDQANVKVCLCDTDTAPVFRGISNIDVLDVPALDLRKCDAGNPKISFPGHHIAYVVFTSGSTGRPKGVAVTMDNLLGNIQVLSELYQVNAGDRLLQACSQAFDVSVFEIFFTFYSGVCLCAAPKDVLYHDLEASIRAFSISHLSLTPTVAALINPLNVPSVRFLVTAGEAVTDLVHRRWATRGLHQGYGPSETTNICTVKMNVSQEDALGNVGPPLRNTSAFVISPGADFKILPTGAVGELAFGGEQVFRGYIAMEQLNVEKILHHPKFGRLYRSGDLGRMLPDGSLFICGRVDNQVKIRGNRIELGEINALLLQEPGIRDCTTLVVGNDPSEQSLAAFVVVECPQRDTSNGLHVLEVSEDMLARIFERLRDSLPSYMIPSMVVPVTKLPLTSQDKLDRRILQQLLDDLDGETKSGFSDDKEIPDSGESGKEWSEEERIIARALVELLKISESELSRHRSFFAFGLNSLHAIAFARLLSTKVGAEISVGMVLRNTTVARLARAVASLSSSTINVPNGNTKECGLLPLHVLEAVRTSCSSLKGQIERILPCTPLQEAMLSANSARSQYAYCNSLTIRVHGDLVTLKRCWTSMTARHSILRTRFVRTEEPSHPYVQVVLKDQALPWQELSDSKNDFDLRPVARTKLLDESDPFCIQVHRADDIIRLVLRMHHAMYDGISISQLLQDTELAYHGRAIPPTGSFEQFLSAAKMQSGNDATEFWSNKLDAFCPKPFPKLQTSVGPDEVAIQSSLPVSPMALESYCKRHALSPMAVFQTALAKILACCQDATDFCFGNVVSGRTVPVEGVERLVAPCFNTIPIRINLAGTSSNKQLANQLHQYNMEALPYQLTPLRRIQALCDSPMKHLFDALLILQPPPQPLDSSIWTIEREDGAMGMPLVFEIMQNTESYELLLHYSQSVIPESLAQVLSSSFASALKSCLTYPSGDVKYFNGIDDAELFGKLSVEACDLAEVNWDSSDARFEWTEEEDVIRNVFARLSGLEKTAIQRETSMYQIGLDSLNAAQVAAQLRSLGVSVDAVNIIECLTPVAIAVQARKNGSSKSVALARIDLDAFDRQHRRQILKQLPNIDPQMVEYIRPCTSVQCGMVAQSLNSQGGLYINHVTYSVPASIAVASLQKAWSAVSTRHQVLRMGFHQLNDSQSPFVMSIMRQSHAPCPFTIVKEDIETGVAEKRATDLIMTSIKTRAWCVQILCRQGDTLMLLSLHHALYDAESLNLILADLQSSLSSFELEPETNIDEVLKAALTKACDLDGSSTAFWSRTLRNVT